MITCPCSQLGNRVHLYHQKRIENRPRAKWTRTEDTRTFAHSPATMRGVWPQALLEGTCPTSDWRAIRSPLLWMGYIFSAGNRHDSSTKLGSRRSWIACPGGSTRSANAPSNPATERRTLSEASVLCRASCKTSPGSSGIWLRWTVKQVLKIKAGCISWLEHRICHPNHAVRQKTLKIYGKNNV